MEEVLSDNSLRRIRWEESVVFLRRVFILLY